MTLASLYVKLTSSMYLTPDAAPNLNVFVIEKIISTNQFLESHQRFKPDIPMFINRKIVSKDTNEISPYTYYIYSDTNFQWSIGHT